MLSTLFNAAIFVIGGSATVGYAVGFTMAKKWYKN